MLTDDSILTISIYAGRKLKDVPASYFVYLNDIYGVSRISDLGVYISENIDALRERKQKETK